MFTNVIFCEKQDFFDILCRDFSLDVQKNKFGFFASDAKNTFVLFFGELENFEIFCQQYQVIRTIFLGRIYALGNSSYQSGDFIVPNTYVQEEKKPIFCEYGVGETFDMGKLSIHFSGVVSSLSSEKINHDTIIKLEKDGVDLYHHNVYDFFEKIKNEGMVGLFFVGEELPDFTKNILEIMVSEDE